MQDSNSEFVCGYIIGFHLWRVCGCITLFPLVNGFWVHHSIPQSYHERSLLLNTLTPKDLRMLSHLILEWKKDALQASFMLTHVKPTCWFLFIQTAFARNRLWGEVQEVGFNLDRTPGEIWTHKVCPMSKIAYLTCGIKSYHNLGQKGLQEIV